MEEIIAAVMDSGVFLALRDPLDLPEPLGYRHHPLTTTCLVQELPPTLDFSDNQVQKESVAAQVTRVPKGAKGKRVSPEHQAHLGSFLTMCMIFTLQTGGRRETEAMRGRRERREHRATAMARVYPGLQDLLDLQDDQGFRGQKERVLLDPEACQATQDPQVTATQELPAPQDCLV